MIPPMRLLELTLPTPIENLALDEALLLAAEEAAGGEVLRLWENHGFAVVLGSSGCVIDANLPLCEADSVPILRRSSGGGTVLVGPGCLCFSFVLAYDSAPGLNEIPASNRYVLGRMRHALRTIVPDAVLEGTSDLAVDGRKFAGNAQQRKRRHFLHHGTLLCGFDLEKIARYLNPPERQPEYRRNRSHSDFVMNLPVGVAEVKRLLIAEWQPAGEYEPLPLERAAELMTEKYSRDEWNRRR
jgi:lipoate---protein ligase